MAFDLLWRVGQKGPTLGLIGLIVAARFCPSTRTSNLKLKLKDRWIWSKCLKIFSRIQDIYLYSNEFWIGESFSSKCKQMALTIVYNASNQKTNITPNNQLMKICNFAFIPTKDFLTLKALTINFVFFKVPIRNIAIGSCNVSYHVFYWSWQSAF